MLDSWRLAEQRSAVVTGVRVQMLVRVSGVIKCPQILLRKREAENYSCTEIWSWVNLGKKFDSKCPLLRD